MLIFFKKTKKLEGDTFHFPFLCSAGANVHRQRELGDF